MNALDSIAHRIDAMAHRHLGGGARSLVRMTGGASQELWAFEVATAADTTSYVLRRTPDDDRIDRTGAPGLRAEAAVIAAVGDRGVPVAPIIHVLDPSDELGDGFVARRMPGEALGRRVVRSPDFAAIRGSLAADCGAILARIHATPSAALPALSVVSPAAAVERMARSLDRSAIPRPVFAAALAWLYNHCPPDTPDALVHGDFRTGNFLLTPDGISAVLDWEGCHIGDPIADLGWLCMPVWRFGSIGLPVGGFGCREDLCAAYAAQSGKPVDRSRLRFWEMFAMLRWGMTCAAMADAVAHGERSIERAAVGRRACEAEIELLHALAPEGRCHA